MTVRFDFSGVEQFLAGLAAGLGIKFVLDWRKEAQTHLETYR
jgi:hypothetical protein